MNDPRAYRKQEIKRAEDGSIKSQPAWPAYQEDIPSALLLLDYCQRKPKAGCALFLAWFLLFCVILVASPRGSHGEGLGVPEGPLEQLRQVAPVAQVEPDYDYAGAEAAGAKKTDGFWPDRWKLPNHITFSVESVYSSPWWKANGVWHYRPSPWVLSQHPPAQLRAYFAEKEPKAILVLP